MHSTTLLPSCQKRIGYHYEYSTAVDRCTVASISCHDDDDDDDGDALKKAQHFFDVFCFVVVMLPPYV